jgi:hypothetical protein
MSGNDGIATRGDLLKNGGGGLKGYGTLSLKTPVMSQEYHDEFSMDGTHNESILVPNYNIDISH